MQQKKELCDQFKFLTSKEFTLTQLKKLVQRMEECRVEKDSFICREGEPFSSLYFMREGCVLIFKRFKLQKQIDGKAKLISDQRNCISLHCTQNIVQFRGFNVIGWVDNDKAYQYSCKALQ